MNINTGASGLDDLPLFSSSSGDKRRKDSGYFCFGKELPLGATGSFAAGSSQEAVMPFCHGQEATSRGFKMGGTRLGGGRDDAADEDDNDDAEDADGEQNPDGACQAENASTCFVLSNFPR